MIGWKVFLFLCASENSYPKETSHHPLNVIPLSPPPLTTTKKDIVNKTIGHVVVKLFHTIPWGTWTGQKHNTLTTPCFCRRNSHGSQSAMFSAPSWEFVKLRVNVSVSPLGLCAGNGSVESVFLCVGSGCRWRVSQRFWKSLRRSSIIREQETGWGFALFAFMGEL